VKVPLAQFGAQVPLFLPVYAFQRLRDLRGIARQEARFHSPVMLLAWAA